MDFRGCCCGRFGYCGIWDWNLGTEALEYCNEGVGAGGAGEEGEDGEGDRAVSELWAGKRAGGRGCECLEEMVAVGEEWEEGKYSSCVKDQES